MRIVLALIVVVFILGACSNDDKPANPLRQSHSIVQTDEVISDMLFTNLCSDLNSTTTNGMSCRHASKVLFLHSIYVTTRDRAEVSCPLFAYQARDIIPRKYLRGSSIVMTRSDLSTRLGSCTF